jgi:hypothetical protein
VVNDSPVSAARINQLSQGSLKKLRHRVFWLQNAASNFVAN